MEQLREFEAWHHNWKLWGQNQDIYSHYTSTTIYPLRRDTFLWHCLWNSTVTIQSPMLHFLGYVVVHFFTVFPVWRLLVSVHMRRKHWGFLSSLACVTGILSAGLIVWPWAEFPYRTREEYFGDFFIENFQWHLFLAWFGCPLAAFASLLFS
jgi:hypothetical protein